MESTFLSRRIALILGKRSASPLAWRVLGWIELKATSSTTSGFTLR